MSIKLHFSVGLLWKGPLECFVFDNDVSDTAVDSLFLID